MSDKHNIKARVETLEEQVEALLEQNQQLKAQNEKVSNLFQQFKQGAISRRAFITSVAALGGVGYAAGSASAAPSWGSSTGNIGEEAQPLSYGYIQDLTTQSLSTDDLDIGTADFVSAGDVVTVSSLSPFKRSASTSSTSYTFELDLADHRVDFGELIPNGAQAVVSMAASVSAGTDETYDIRFFNDNDQEEIVSIETISSTGIVSSGWVPYSPPTTGSPIRARFQHRTNPGTNPSEAFVPMLNIGIQL